MTDSMYEYLIEHIQTVQNRIADRNKDNEQDIDIFLNLFSRIKKVGKKFCIELQKVFESFKQKKEHIFSDQRLDDCYNFILDQVLQYSAILQKKFNDIEDQTKNLRQFSKDANFMNKDIDTQLKTNISVLQSKFNQYQEIYSQYIDIYQNTTQRVLNNQKSHRKLSLEHTTNIYEYEEKAIQTFQEVKTLINQSYLVVDHELDNIQNLQDEAESKIQNTALFIAEQISFDKQLTLRQFKSYQDNQQNHKAHFKKFRRQISLDFDEVLNLKSYNIQFCDFTRFQHLQTIFNSRYIQFIQQKVEYYAKYTPTLKKIYSEILLQKIYNSNIELKRHQLQQVHEVMEEENSRNFFMYNLILKKSYYRLEKPQMTLSLSKIQIKNIVQIAQYFFLMCNTDKNVNYELVYQFLKYCYLIQTKQKDSVSTFLYKTYIFHENNFWVDLYKFLEKYLQFRVVDPRQQERRSTKKIFKNIKHIFKNQKQQERSGTAIMAFEEISTLLFVAKLDFEHITNVLFKLSTLAGISPEVVQELLQKNSHIFETQVLNEEINPYENQKYKLQQKFKQKEDKLVFVLKHSVEFFDRGQDILNCLITNKYVYKKKNKILKAVLLNISFLSNNLRCKIFLQLLESCYNLHQLKTDIKHLEKDQIQIIALDIKRTFNKQPNFDKHILELILQNIADKNIGNFSYYQGLNYLTSYFFLLFEQDELKTYNFVMTLLNKYFAQYIDSELIGLKKVFYFLRRLLRQNHELLIEYFETELKLDVEIVMASWCLTLFTTCIQFQPESEILHQIIDIFVAKGWVGFLRVVMVIFDDLKSTLIQMEYEDVLMTLSDITKNDFEILKKCQKDGQPIDLKKKLKKYKHIGKQHIAKFGGEYTIIQERIETFWHKLNKKIKKRNQKV